MTNEHKDLPALYRKTALVSAEQFLPDEGKIPKGVFSDGNGDPRKSHNYSFVLNTKEGRHELRYGDYVCTGPAGEQWNVERSIFEATYELAARPEPAGAGVGVGDVPEAAQQNGGLVRAALIDLLTAEAFALNGTSILRIQNELRASFARARAALKAPSATQAAPQAQQSVVAGDSTDPMDWKLPCDVKVGHGTIGKGCSLRTLVARMQVLYDMAHEARAATLAATQSEEKARGVVALSPHDADIERLLDDAEGGAA